MQRFGPYTAEEKIGQGGMARVYRGTAQDGRAVVIKVPLSRDEAAHARLRDEARAGLRLSHPALVETYDLVESPEGPALIAGFIDGPALSTLWRAEGALSAHEVAHLGGRLADGLRALHAATERDGTPLNIVHRDVTATNVIVDRAGHPRIIDLGIARSDGNQHTTDLDIVRGTARYLSPEIVHGAHASQADDVWALGCTLLEAALGEPVIEGDKAMKILRAVAEQNPLTGREGRLPPGVLALLKQVFVPAAQRVDAATLARGFAALDDSGGAARLAERVERVMPAPVVADTDEMFARGGPAPDIGLDEVGGIEPLPGGGRDLSAFDFSDVDQREVQRQKVERPAFKAGPIHSGELELDLGAKERSAEARKASKTGSLATPSVYPDTTPRKRGSATPFIVLVLVIAGLGAGAWLLRDRLGGLVAGKARIELPPDPEQQVLQKKRLEELGSDVPDCYQPGVDMWFAYEGKDGSSVVVPDLVRVPAKLRKSARCVQPVK